MQFIDLGKQYQRLEKKIDRRIKRVLEHCQFIMGPEVSELESALSEYVSAKHSITVGSGTDALLIALMALGVGPGDEVVTTAFTFFASVEVILLLGAKPVFVDIDPQTYLMNVDQMADVLTPRTKAIIPVNLFGQVVDMDAINQLAKERGIMVIEDAAQSFGATYKDRQSSGLADIGCTSFFPAKPLGCYGDGGAIFTNNDELAEKMKQLRVHGQSERYIHTSIGINGRFDTIQAAILLEKLAIFPEEVRKRQQIAEHYSSLLKEQIMTPHILPYNTSTFAQYTVRVSNRDEVCAQLNAAGIPTAIHYPIPVTKQPALQNMDYSRVSLPHTEKAAAEVMSLPMHPYLTMDEIEQISEQVLLQLSLESL